MNFLIATAYAQDAAPAQPSAMASLIPFALVFVVFYFLMIKPQKKKLEEEKSFLSTLKKGDEIFTKSGIIGTIYGINDAVVTLEIQDGVKFKMLKSQIGGNANALFKTEKTTDKK